MRWLATVAAIVVAPMRLRPATHWPLSGLALSSPSAAVSLTESCIPLESLFCRPRPHRFVGAPPRSGTALHHCNRLLQLARAHSLHVIVVVRLVVVVVVVVTVLFVLLRRRAASANFSPDKDGRIPTLALAHP
uniref:Uncharacterized protein n=1 Tax=Plectus sambesii TaxID=2011161 RepID=A0A914UPX1_9BILA